MKEWELREIESECRVTRIVSRTSLGLGMLPGYRAMTPSTAFSIKNGQNNSFLLFYSWLITYIYILYSFSKSIYCFLIFYCIIRASIMILNLYLNIVRKARLVHVLPRENSALLKYNCILKDSRMFHLVNRKTYVYRSYFFFENRNLKFLLII